MLYNHRRLVQFRFRASFALFLALALFCGCSQKQPSTGATAPLPQIHFVETAEAKESKEIKAHALGLFLKRDYQAVEAMAAAYHTSKEGYASGLWKLAHVYSGWEPDDELESVLKARITQVDSWHQVGLPEMTKRF